MKLAYSPCEPKLVWYRGEDIFQTRCNAKRNMRKGLKWGLLSFFSLAYVLSYKWLMPQVNFNHKTHSSPRPYDYACRHFFISCHILFTILLVLDCGWVRNMPINLIKCRNSNVAKWIHLRLKLEKRIWENIIENLIQCRLYSEKNSLLEEGEKSYFVNFIRKQKTTFICNCFLIENLNSASKLIF